LSMSTGSLLKAKKVIKSFSMTELKEMFEVAVKMSGSSDVRQMYTERLDERGLGGLIRAGK
jgi:phosphotransferase system enzyme I (PtsP)